MSVTEPEVPEVEETEEDEETEDDDEESDSSSIDEVAQQVLRGEWGQGQQQRRKLAEAGYDPNEVRKVVTRLRNHL